MTMHRNSASHKGENGKVMIIGGCQTQHGAPLFSALAAEASGVDLLYVALPSCHAQVARMQSLNFQVHPFAGNTLAKADINPLLELMASMDAVVIGPGIERSAVTLKILQELIEACSSAMVLDASALQPWTLAACAGKNAVLTPHLGELERMGVDPESIESTATQHGVTIHLKGVVDRIASPGGTVEEVTGGNAGLTVGGTGDALAGLICGLLAQGLDQTTACVTASKVIKEAGSVLYKESGFAYTTRDVIGRISSLLHSNEA